MNIIYTKFKTLFLALLIAVLSFGLTACSPSNPKTGDKKLKIVTTLFPQYSFAKEIGGDFAEVTLLIPPGANSHTYEPTPADLLKLQQADIFFYTSDEMEPWVAKIRPNLDSHTLAQSVATGINLLPTDGHEDHDHHDHHHGHYDPHVFLDPILCKTIVNNIKDAMVLKEEDAGRKESYQTNCENYNQKLDKLDRDISSTLTDKKRDTIVFSGSFAYKYFFARYGLKHYSALNSCNENGDISAKRLAEVIDFVKQNKIPVIYYEESIPTKICESISAQTGAKMLRLSTVHNLTPEEKEKGTTYLDMMQQNLQHLKEGLL